MKNFYILFIMTAFFFTQISIAEEIPQTNFPVEGEMRTRVDFWKQVYTDIKTTEAFIHDSEDLSIIYKKVSLPSNRRKRTREAKKQKRLIAKILKSIAKKNYLNLTTEEQRYADIIGEKTYKEIMQLTRRLRYQYGLKDRYYKGLIRSYSYLEYIKKTFKDLGLPDELVFLPHVESSFNYKAYSKVGAAGIWQFMRTTGRMYKLKISYIVDERRDPLKATKAAARLLRDNYRILKSWPLALTAYNHGARSIKRAQKKLGTSDINKIIQGYEGRRFGFASKNFYATFMATVEISKDPSKYFENFEKPEKFTYSSFKLPKNYTVSEISKNLKISKDTIKKYNYSIRSTAYRSHLYLPKNFELKIPPTSKEELSRLKNIMKSLKGTIESFDLQRTHIVSKGESLFDISKIYKTSMSKIIIFNRISNPSRIFPGMKVKIPGKKDNTTKQIAIKEVDKTKQVATISKEKSPLKYKENQKSGSYLSKMKTFFDVAPKARKKLNAKALVADLPTPLPVINLQSYLLDLTPVGDDIYSLTIETEETLGHLAGWGNVKAQSIRELNNLSYKSHITFGKQLRIRLSSKRINRFKELRNKYHLSIQEDFYNNFKVIDEKEYLISRGDSITHILKKNSMPYWLLRKQQKNGVLNSNLIIGQIIQIPTVEVISDED